MFDDSNDHIHDNHDDDDELKTTVHEVTLRFVSFEICFGALEIIHTFEIGTLRMYILS